MKRDENILDIIKHDYEKLIAEYKIMLDALGDIAQGTPMPRDRAIKTLNEIFKKDE